MQIYNIEVKKNNGEIIKIDEYKGKTILIVNTATKCGLSNQFETLENLYQKYKEKNFIILGFPCSQFANQEENDDKIIDQICKINFGVTFPIFAKIDVNGKNESELFRYLKNNSRSLFSKNIKWNFTKFLIDKNGEIVKRYSPTKIPSEKEIEALLN